MSNLDNWLLNQYSELSRYKWEGDMEVRGEITFYEAEAYKLFPEGCQCSETNGGGDCEWCQVYYYGMGEEA